MTNLTVSDKRVSFGLASIIAETRSAKHGDSSGDAVASIIRSSASETQKVDVG
jgi:hypothetical protein